VYTVAPKQPLIIPGVLHDLFHLPDMLFEIFSFLPMDSIGKLLYTCTSFNETVTNRDLLLPFVTEIVKRCKRGNLVGLVKILEQYGHCVDQETLQDIVKTSFSDHHSSKMIEIKNTIYTALDLMDINLGTIIGIMTESEPTITEVANSFFLHPKVNVFVEEILDYMCEEKLRIGLFGNSYPVMSWAPFAVKSPIFTVGIETMILLMEKDNELINNIPDDIPILWSHSKARKFILNNFFCAESLVQTLLLSRMTLKEKRLVVDNISYTNKEVLHYLLLQDPHLKQLAQYIHNALGTNYEHMDLIMMCLAAQYEMFAPMFDLKTLEENMIEKKQFHLLASLLEIEGLPVIDRVASSPRKFLLSFIKESVILPKYSRTESRMWDWKEGNVDHLVTLIETVFRIFPHIKVRKNDDEMVRQARQTEEIRIVNAILSHPSYDTISDEVKKEFTTGVNTISKASIRVMYYEWRELHYRPRRFRRYYSWQDERDYMYNRYDSDD